jgi:hypothetical protein
MNNYLKTSTMLLMCWYGILRWILLSQGSSTSIDWVHNWLGNSVALISLCYMAYFLIALVPQKSKLFFAATSLLLLLNSYFVILMINIFVNEPTSANFGYTILDLSIASYYFFIVKLCLFGDVFGIKTFNFNMNCIAANK